VRADDPRLEVRSAERRAQRVAEGRAPTPRKVTLTRHPGMDPAARLFGAGNVLVYCASAACIDTRARLRDAATVVDAGADPEVGLVAEDLAARGVRRLMVEGGQQVLGQFLEAGLADELQLVVAPVLVGDPGAPRLAADGWMPGGRALADLAEVRRIEDVVLLRYALSARFEQDEPGGTTP
jgi:5-amino-6-(5-phosphoribosylamino)uracil reductase